MSLLNSVYGLVVRPVALAVKVGTVTVGLVRAAPLLYKNIAEVGPTKAFGIMPLWQTLSQVPGGKEAFSTMVGIKAPYSASIGATFQTLSPGSSTATMEERPWLGNPYNSIHAVALCNLGEMVSGLAATTKFHEIQAVQKVNARGIPVKISTEFFKKSRGVITATSDVKIPTALGVHKNVEVVANLTDQNGDLVARFTALWYVTIEAPKPTPPTA